MRYSSHFILRSAALLLLVGALFLGCNEAPTAPTAEEGLTSGPAFRHGIPDGPHFSDLNDRFASESGASGWARVRHAKTARSRPVW